MLARVENGQVIEYRAIGIDAVPEHKRHLWRTVEEEGDGPNKETIIEADRVLIVRSTPPPAPLTQADYAAAIEEHIDRIARAKAYSGAVSLASYANSSIPAWKAEAETFIAWRDAVWAYAYLIMGEVVQGLKQPPTIEGLIADLPTIDWPS
jgi:uncharacterized membrane protein YgcG